MDFRLFESVPRTREKEIAFTMERIRLSHVSKEFRSGRGNTVAALRDIDFVAAEGESIAIMGVSGSGKSTLLNIIGCMDYATGGEYLYDGQNAEKAGDSGRAKLRRNEFGIVPQNYDILPSDTVAENIALPMVLAGKKSAHIKGRVKELAEAVGLGDKLKRKAKYLSGGETQRVAIARALANDPKVILADEPTSALDYETAKQVMSLLRKLCSDSGKTLIFVTHDSRLSEFADRTVEIKDGVICE